MTELWLKNTFFAITSKKEQICFIQNYADTILTSINPKMPISQGAPFLILCSTQEPTVHFCIYSSYLLKRSSDDNKTQLLLIGCNEKPKIIINKNCTYWSYLYEPQNLIFLNSGVDRPVFCSFKTRWSRKNVVSLIY